ncbi:MAG TPA: PAS domain S-box protein, partial [Allocoleopsis sp.]
QRLQLSPQQSEQNELSTIISELEIISTTLEEQNNLYFRAMIDTFPLLIWVGNKNGEREYFNQAWLKFTGANFHTQINQEWIKYLHPEDEKKCLNHSLLAWQKQESFVIEYRLKTGQGTYRYILDNAIPIYTTKGEFNGYTGWCIDITKYKQVETDLQTAKEQLEAVLNAVPGFVSWVDNQGIYQGVNSHLANAFNLQPEDFIGQELGFLQNSPEFAQFMWQFLANSTLTESKIINNSDKYFLIVGQKYNQGKNAVSVGIDISNHKQTEEELVKSEAKFRALVNAMPDLLIRMNDKGTYLDFMPAKNFATNMPYQDMIGHNIYEVFSEEFAAQSIKMIQKALTTNELQIYEYQIALESGKIVDQEARICPLPEHEKQVLIIVRDISDRKLIENTLQKINNELEHRVQERTVELNTTISQLQQEIMTRKQVENLNNLLAIAIEQAGD